MTWTETQGRFGNGQGQEFAEAFLVEYWRPSLNQWITYKDSRGEKVSFVNLMLLFMINIFSGISRRFNAAFGKTLENIIFSQYNFIVSNFNLYFDFLKLEYL